LGIFRILFYLALPWLTIFSQTAETSAALQALLHPPFGWAWLFEVIPASNTTALLAKQGTFLFATLASLGILTRYTQIACLLFSFYGMTLYQSFGKIGHIHHLVWFQIILILSRSGDGYSIDSIFSAVRRADKGDTRPLGDSYVYAMPLKFIWISFGLVYFFPGFWKIWNVGIDWPFSSNLRQILYFRWVELDWVPPFRGDKIPGFLQTGGAATIVFELSFILAIFNKHLRRLFALSGPIFHFSTNFMMQILFLPLLVCYPAFIEWDRMMRRFGTWRFPKVLHVLYDGNCTLCRRSIAIVRTLDLFDRTIYINGMDRSALEAGGLSHLSEVDLATDMHAVLGDEIGRGYGAWRLLAGRNPLLIALWPLMGLAPVAALGRAIYRRVADSRLCSIRTQPPGAFVVVPVAVPWPLIAVFSALFAANLAMGITENRKQWPVCCYPTFAILQKNRYDTVWFEVREANGRTTILDHQQAASRIGIRQSLYDQVAKRLISRESKQGGPGLRADAIGVMAKTYDTAPVEILLVKVALPIDPDVERIPFSRRVMGAGGDEANPPDS